MKSQITFTFLLTTMLFSSSFSQETIDEPVHNCRRREWNDPRLNSESGRWDILKEATYLAFAQLGYIGRNSNVVKLYEYNNDETYFMRFHDMSKAKPVLKKRGFNPLMLENKHRTLSIQVRYVNFNRTANVQSLILPTINTTICPYEYHDVKYDDGVHKRLDCNCEYDMTKAYWQSISMDIKGKRHCYKEELSAIIEVFTDVFDRGYLLIPSERPFEDDIIDKDKNVPSGRYADTAVEAITYLVLHELGHFEYYISKESKYIEFQPNHKQLNPIGEGLHDEESAWEYASSVSRAFFARKTITN